MNCDSAMNSYESNAMVVIGQHHHYDVDDDDVCNMEEDYDMENASGHSSLHEQDNCYLMNHNNDDCTKQIIFKPEDTALMDNSFIRNKNALQHVENNLRNIYYNDNRLHKRQKISMSGEMAQKVRSQQQQQQQYHGQLIKDVHIDDSYWYQIASQILLQTKSWAIYEIQNLGNNGDGSSVGGVQQQQYCSTTVQRKHTLLGTIDFAQQQQRQQQSNSTVSNNTTSTMMMGSDYDLKQQTRICNTTNHNNIRINNIQTIDMMMDGKTRYHSSTSTTSSIFVKKNHHNDTPNVIVVEFYFPIHIMVDCSVSNDENRRGILTVQVNIINESSTPNMITNDFHKKDGTQRVLQRSLVAKYECCPTTSTDVGENGTRKMNDHFPSTSNSSSYYNTEYVTFGKSIEHILLEPIR